MEDIYAKCWQRGRKYPVSDPVYVLGIDGGATKTHGVLCGLNGEVVGESFSGPSNLETASAAQVREYIMELAQTFEPFLVKNGGRVGAVCLGSAGVSHQGAKETLETILHEIYPDASILVVGDMEAALAANPQNCGILLIAGTGSICFGRQTDGVTARAGGWGRNASDGGSGFWIVMQAFARVFHELDGVYPVSLMGRKLMESMNFSTQRQLSDFLNSEKADKTTVASYCTVVAECADQGDTAAIEILEQGASQLAKLAQAVQKKLDLPADFTVMLGGSVAEKCCVLQEKLKALLQQQGMNNIQLLQQQAALGAVRLARDLLVF